MKRRKGVMYIYIYIYIYSIPCDDCPRTFIGQTDRPLDLQLCEHHCALKKGDMMASAIAESVFSSNQRVDLSKSMVIDAHPHTLTCCMLESWHIQHHHACKP